MACRVTNFGKITKIERQQKRKNRYSIFVDGEYSFSVDAEILLQHNLTAGQAVSEKQIEELLEEDELKRVKIQAFRYLANRDHSEKELADKLKKKAFSEPVIRDVITDLKQKHFLNDSAFAEIFARNRLIQKPVGRRQLRFDLLKKGISETILDETLTAVYEEFNESELARRLAEKKMKLLQNQEYQKAKKKVADFLLRRGFDWEIVRQILEEHEQNN